MLYRFQSKATGDVLMLEGNARHLLEIAGKDPGAKGIFTVEQIPAAISALEDAAARESTENRHNSDAYAVEGHTDEAETLHVGLSQRAKPLVDMLKKSLEQGQAVLWGASVPPGSQPPFLNIQR